ncbi:MAG: SDR family oxidoreductase, partial [Acidobacteriota bacterium]
LALSVAATDKVFSPDFGLFSASKAALDALVRNWAAALGPRRIRVNGIAPGIVAVNFRAALLEDPGFRQQLEADTALGRAAQIDDVLDVITFLTSDTARWITGQVIEASGGWRL